MNWQHAEHVLAILGAVSILFHALEAGCNAAGWTKYEGIFHKIGAFVQGFLGGIKPPTAGGAAACLAIFVTSAIWCSPVKADTVAATASTLGITGTQAVLYTWKSNEVVQSTVFTFAETKKIDSIGAWNILWQGWVIDAGPAYDDTNILKSGTVLIGKKLGVLGDYVPIDFPFKDKITFKAYVAGVHAEDLFTKPKCQGVSGMGYISATVKF